MHLVGVETVAIKCIRQHNYGGGHTVPSLRFIAFANQYDGIKTGNRCLAERCCQSVIRSHPEAGSAEVQNLSVSAGQQVKPPRGLEQNNHINTSLQALFRLRTGGRGLLSDAGTCNRTWRRV